MSDKLNPHRGPDYHECPICRIKMRRYWSQSRGWYWRHETGGPKKGCGRRIAAPIARWVDE